MTSQIRQIENDTYQIDTVLEKHGDRLEQVTLKLLRQLTKNIRQNANNVRDSFQDFHDRIIGDDDE